MSLVTKIVFVIVVLPHVIACMKAKSVTPKYVIYVALATIFPMLVTRRIALGGTGSPTLAFFTIPLVTISTLASAYLAFMKDMQSRMPSAATEQIRDLVGAAPIAKLQQKHKNL